MSPGDRTALWTRLKDAGLVTGDPPAASDALTPWYVRVMLGVTGWIGAIFILGFVGAAFTSILKSAPALLLTGTALCTVAAIVFHGRLENDFADQAVFVISLAGQALVFLGIERMKLPDTGAALLMAAVEGALFLLIPNFLHRVWSAMAALFAVTFALASLGFREYAPALLTAGSAVVWLNEFSHPKRGSLIRALGYGLALVALLILFMSGNDWQNFGRNRIPQIGGAWSVWAGRGLIGMVLVWSVWALQGRAGFSAELGFRRATLAGAIALALVSFKAPGMALTTTLLLIGYAHRVRVLAGLGILGLLAYTSYYYFSLEITLLEKSLLLVSSGLALLAARLALAGARPEVQKEEPRHA